MVITGVGPNSLGEALALAISSQSPAKLILASRTKAKLEQVAAAVQKACPAPSSSPGTPTTAVELVPMDLASQQSVRQAAAAIQTLADGRVDVLINNAGVMVLDRRNTAEGIELQFGTNHLGHFLLTVLLLPQLLRAAGAAGSARIVNVTSAGHRLSPIRFHDYNLEGRDVPPEEQPPPGLPPAFYAVSGAYNGWLAYGQSKTANILFSRALNERLKGTGVTSYAVHPGCMFFLLFALPPCSVGTKLSSNLDESEPKPGRGSHGNHLQHSNNMEVARPGRRNDAGRCAGPCSERFEFDFCLDSAVLSLWQLTAGLDPAPSDVYLSDCQLAETAPHAQSLDAAERLFRLSEDLVGEKFSL